MKISRSRDLQDIRSHQEFERLCHELLAAEYNDYQAVAGEGGDEGIDSFRGNREIVYQFKFSVYRLRPGEYFADLDRVVKLYPLREWVLVIPRDPTPRLLDLARARARLYNIRVTILDRTVLDNLISKHATIREKYFPELAKEATVLRLHKRVATKDDVRRLQKEVRANRPVKLHAVPPPESLTPLHRKEIQKTADKIVRESRSKIKYGQVFSMLKNEFGEVDNWYWIPDSRFPEVSKWLHNFTYGVKDQYGVRDSTTLLKGVIQSQRRQLGLSESEYRDVLRQLTGVDSTTKMDKEQLRSVCDYFNLLIARGS